MIQKIKRYMFASAAAIMMAVPIALPTVTYAACNGIASGIATGASDASGDPVNCDPTNADGSSLSKLARQVVNIFSIVVGAVAVIMIIYGGFRYITSGGDSGSVGTAKNTLIYAIVGLIIVACAQLIVHFVLAQTSSATAP